MIDAMIRRIAVHRWQSLGGGLHLLENCPAYIATIEGVDVSYATICRWWARVRKAIGWYEVMPAHARAMGGELRELRYGQRWGRHMVITDRARDAARDYCRRNGIRLFAEHETTAWHTVAPVLIGTSLMCCCPHHDDTRPSMQLCPVRHWASCYSCGARCTYDPGRGVSDPKEARPLQPRQVVRTIQVKKGAQSDGSHRVLDLRGGASWSRSGGDLLDILARCRGHEIPGDRFLRIDPSEVSEWRRGPFGMVPRSVRTTAVTHLLVDVDDLDSMGMWDDPLVPVARRIEQLLDRLSQLAGDIGVLRSSEYGLHVIVKLARPRDPSWRRSVECATLHHDVEAIVMQALADAGFTGGHADPMARTGGRFTRMPGARIREKDGQRDPWFARAVYITGRLDGPRYRQEAA